jgi:hypothetical protein
MLACMYFARGIDALQKRARRQATGTIIGSHAKNGWKNES